MLVNGVLAMGTMSAGVGWSLMMKVLSVKAVRCGDDMSMLVNGMPAVEAMSAGVGWSLTMKFWSVTGNVSAARLNMPMVNGVLAAEAMPLGWTGH